jgi:hypothetical protein
MATKPFEMIRSLIQEIRLVPENGRVQVQLRGELAGILALSAAQPHCGCRAGANQDDCGGWI